MRPSPPRHPQHQTDFHLRVRFSANGAMSVSTTFWSFQELMSFIGGVKLDQAKGKYILSVKVHDLGLWCPWNKNRVTENSTQAQFWLS